MRVRIRIRSGPVQESSSADLFSHWAVQQPLQWRAMVSSVAVHAALLAASALASDVLSYVFYTRIDTTNYRAEVVQFRVPEVLYAPAPPAAKRKSREPAAARPNHKSGGATPAPAAPPAQTSAASARRAFTLPENLELPRPAVPVEAPPVILQSGVPQAGARLTGPVPSIASWTSRLEVKRPTKQFVAPGRVEPAAEPPRLASPPVIAVANSESVPRDINVSIAGLTVAPALPVPNSTTAPVRNQASDPAAGTIAAHEGAPGNLIVISNDRVPAGNVVTVPRGLQRLPATAEAGTASNALAAGATEGPGRVGAGSGVSGGQGAGRGGTMASSGGDKGTNGNHGPAGGRGGGAASSSGASPGGPAREGTGAGAANEPGQLAGRVNAQGAPGAATPAAVTRIKHLANGNFDVVISQSAARDDLAGISGILKGSPVYTVYVPVGDRREWLLEYCLPLKNSPAGNSYEITVGDVPPVAPPYPVETAVPTHILSQKRSRRIIYHGYLTQSGVFRDVQTRSGDGPVAQQIAALLNEWQFRPAFVNKATVDVEVLLIVPAILN